MEAVTAGFRSRKGRQWQRRCLADCILTKKSSGGCPIWSDITTLMTRVVSEPFYGVSIIVEGMMQGMGNTMMPFVCSIAGMWGVRIVGTFICTQLLGMGLVSAWACMIAHNLLLFLLFAGYYISGKWNPMNRKNAVQSVKTAD